MNQALYAHMNDKRKMKKKNQRWTGAAKVREVLFVEEKKERLHGVMQRDLETSGPLSQVGSWVL
jgi:hypothetical protein